MLVALMLVGVLMLGVCGAALAADDTLLTIERFDADGKWKTDIIFAVKQGDGEAEKANALTIEITGDKATLFECDEDGKPVNKAVWEVTVTTDPATGTKTLDVKQTKADSAIKWSFEEGTNTLKIQDVPYVAPRPVEYAGYVELTCVGPDGEPLAAEFVLSNVASSSKAQTKADGVALVGLLDVGEFTATARKVPEGYALPEKQTVTVTKDNVATNPAKLTVVCPLAAAPTEEPTAEPTLAPTAEPTEAPTQEPTVAPTAEPTAEPTEKPTAKPTATPKPTERPTARPTATAEAEDEDVPKTGDAGMDYLYALMVLSGLCAVALTAALRRTRRS